MGKFEKIRAAILQGNSDRNIGFSDLCFLMQSLGFDLRIKGDHYIFTRADLAEIINIQPLGSKAKAYQVKQVRNLILKYGLTR